MSLDLYNLPPQPHADTTLGPVWLRYIVQLHRVVDQLQQIAQDHETRIEALEP